MSAMLKSRRMTAGFTIIELMVSLAIGTLMLVAVGALIPLARESQAAIQEHNRLNQEAHFAMARMVRAVSGTRRLLLPFPDKPDTTWREHVRQETVPPSPPESGSIKATAVLAVTQSEAVDLDGDGFADADNDRDGLLDEDWPSDITNDSDPGVHLIDDDGNGWVDDGFFNDADDDERLSFSNEDPINGIDDDGDGDIDEDPPGDMNNDNAPGIAGVDDDGDGQTDEGGDDRDDDEDGQADEDWLDPVVFSLQGSSLIERTPVPWDESGSGGVTGRDYIESAIADDVTLLRFERIPQGSGRAVLIDITLELTGSDGYVSSLKTRVRIGGSQ